jgi:hypothetical protein
VTPTKGSVTSMNWKTTLKPSARLPKISMARAHCSMKRGFI